MRYTQRRPPLNSMSMKLGSSPLSVNLDTFSVSPFLTAAMNLCCDSCTNTNTGRDIKACSHHSHHLISSHRGVAGQGFGVQTPPPPNPNQDDL